MMALARRAGLRERAGLAPEAAAALAVFALELSCLRRGAGTFAEQLYGLRRAPPRGAGGGRAAGAGRPPPLALSLRDRVLVALAAAVAPPLRALLLARRDDARSLGRARAAADWLGMGGALLPPREGRRAATRGPGRGPQRQPPPRGFRGGLGSAGAACAPSWSHGPPASSSRLGTRPRFPPQRHTLWGSPGRAPGSRASSCATASSVRRRGTWAGSWKSRGGGGGGGGGPATRALEVLSGAPLRALAAALLVGAQAAEWWRQAVEAADQRRATLSAPPPPAFPPEAPRGARKAGPGLCPACGEPYRHPAVLAPSGRCLCHACALRCASTEGGGKCPVTHAPITPEHVVRLYLPS